MWAFPPNFKFPQETKKSFQIYLYKIGYGGEWQPLLVVEAIDEDEALNLAKNRRDLQEDEMYKAEETF